MVEASLVSFAELGVLTVGIVIALFQLRNIKQTRETELETRQAQLFMQNYQRSASVEWMKRSTLLESWEWEDYNDFRRKYLSEESEVIGEWASLMIQMDGQGYLLKENLVDAEMVYQLGQAGLGHVRQWYKFEPIINKIRENTNNPHFLRWFEYLVEEMVKMRKQKGLPWRYSTELRRFVED